MSHPLPWTGPKYDFVVGNSALLLITYCSKNYIKGVTTLIDAKNLTILA